MFNGRKIIGVCIPRVFDLNAFEYVKYLNDAAVSLGYSLFVYQSNSDFGVYSINHRNDLGESYIFDLIDYSIIDGMVIFSELIKDKELIKTAAARAQERNIPVITVEYPIDGCVNARYDYGDSFEQLIRHVIIDHGLTKVNFIAGIEGNSFSEERLDIYKKILAERGIPYDAERVGYGQFWEMPTVQVMEKFLAPGKELPEAVICSNDVMAMAACKVISEHGYSVPGDIIVTGFDGIEDEKFHNPRLTTCRSDKPGMARLLIEAIDDRLNGRPVPEEIVMNFELDLSQSCGCVSIGSVNAFAALNDMYNRINKYQYSSNSMSNLTALITNVKKPELMLESFARQEDLWDTACCLCYDVFTPKSGIIEFDRKEPFADKMLMIFRGRYNEPSKEVQLFDRKDILPDFDKYIDTNIPLVFSVIHYFDLPMGYMCFNKQPEIILYERIPQITDVYGNGFGNVRMYAAMERLYIYDPMTELYNRRGFYQVIASKFENDPSEGERTVAVVSADLDGLKGINDTYGHAEGDNAIKTVGMALASAAVNGEVCARFGGDEFVAAGVIDSEEGYAEGFKKRVKDYIDEYNKTSGKPYKVSSSIGITCSKTSGATVDELIKISDDLMYADKATKKNVRSRIREN